MGCSTAVIGAQRGDEGKARVVDLLAADADVVARYQGGCNAGHTVQPDSAGPAFSLHGVPSGIARPGVYNASLSGMYVNPLKLVAEMDDLRARGIPVTPANFGLSGRAQVTLKYHLDREAAREAGAGRTGTTLNGISETGAAKHHYDGITVAEFVSDDFPGILAEKLAHFNLENERAIAELAERTAQYAFRGDDLIGPEDVRDRFWALVQERLTLPVGRTVDAYRALYAEARERLRPFVIDEVELRRARGDQRWLFEGAQGLMLGVTMGAYPNVTSSEPHLPPYPVDRRVLVFKAFPTHVGGDTTIGRMPPDVYALVGGKAGDVDQEIGKSTGRTRHRLWFDVVAARHAVTVAPPTHAVLTKLDRFRGVDPIRIVTGYSLRGGTITTLPQNRREYAACAAAEPRFEELPGFHQDITGARRWGDLPRNARSYVERLEEAIGLPFDIVSLGPARDAYLWRTGERTL